LGAFWFNLVQVFPNSITNSLKEIATPAGDRKMREIDLDWNESGDVLIKIEIQSPFIYIHPSGAK